MEHLQLEKPIVYIDLETTGSRYYSDRIIEFSVLKVHPDGSEEIKSRRVNPEMPIDPEAAKVHGISDEEVKKEPTFRQMAKSIREFLEGCTLSGFNILDFDLPILEYEFIRAGVDFSREGHELVDTMAIYHMRIPYDREAKRNLTAAYQYYCGKTLENAQSAEADVRAGAEILDGQLAMYADLPRDVAGLHDVCCEPRKEYFDMVGKFIWLDGEVAFNFGKHKGKTVREVVGEAPDYLSWMMRQEFSPEVMELLGNGLKGEFPSRE